jgi:hypothetical protein
LAKDDKNKIELGKIKLAKPFKKEATFKVASYNKSFEITSIKMDCSQYPRHNTASFEVTLNASELIPSRCEMTSDLIVKHLDI